MPIVFLLNSHGMRPDDGATVILPEGVSVVSPANLNGPYVLERDFALRGNPCANVYSLLLDGRLPALSEGQPWVLQQPGDLVPNLQLGPYMRQHLSRADPFFLHGFDGRPITKGATHGLIEIGAETTFYKVIEKIHQDVDASSITIVLMTCNASPGLSSGDRNISLRYSGGIANAFVLAADGSQALPIPIENMCLPRVGDRGMQDAHRAAATGRLEELARMDRAALGETDALGQKPAHHAANAGHSEALALIASVDPSSLAGRDATGGMPSHFAAASNGTDALRVLRDHAPESLLAVDREGCTPLHWAAYHGARDAITALVHYLGRPALRARDAWRMTPVHIAAMNDNSGIIQTVAMAMARASGDALKLVRRSDEIGLNAAHHAARMGCDRVIQQLALLFGSQEGAAAAFLGTQARDGCTPAHLAASCGHVKVTSVLGRLAAGSFGTRDHWGFVAAHRAAYKGHANVLGALEEAEGGVGASLATRDSEGLTPAHHAAVRGHSGAMAWLASGGATQAAASLGTADNKGRTPSHYAAYNGHVCLTEELALSGVPRDLPDSDGSTPAHLAAFMGHSDTIGALVETGETNALCAPDLSGHSPADLAAKGGHVAVLEVLQAAGGEAVEVSLARYRSPVRVASKFRCM